MMGGKPEADGGRTLTSAQLAVVQDALTDAYGYRYGDADDLEDMEDVDREFCERYQALADQLGLTIS